MEKKEIINLMLGKLNRERSESWEDISKATGLNMGSNYMMSTLKKKAENIGKEKM